MADEWVDINPNDFDLNDKVKLATQFFKDRGWQDHQVAGIVANLWHESAGSFNPEVKGDGGKSYGVAQWNGPRLTGLRQHTKQMGVPENDFLGQLSYVDYELRVPE